MRAGLSPGAPSPRRPAPHGAGIPSLARLAEIARRHRRLHLFRRRLPFLAERGVAMTRERIRTDILILGSGGAGLFAALHAIRANPDLSVTVATKGLIGKCGC